MEVGLLAPPFLGKVESNSGARPVEGDRGAMGW